LFTITATLDCYLLPADGAAAEAVFLKHLEDPYEMWIIAYSFTLVPMIDEIIANSQGGDPIHIYLDLSQSSGADEMPQLKRLVAAGVEVTLGTSPAGTSYITHTKGLVCNDTPPLCWEGSVNFSASGWLQVNTAMVFFSPEWRDQFVQQFNTLRDYAWSNLRSKQLMKNPPAGVNLDAKAPAAPDGQPSKEKSPTKLEAVKPAKPKGAVRKSKPAKKQAARKC
jgi:hypothetical protein